MTLMRQLLKSGASIECDTQMMEDTLLSNEGMLARMKEKKPKKKNKFLEKFRIGI